MPKNKKSKKPKRKKYTSLGKELPEWTPFQNATMPGFEQMAEMTKEQEKRFVGCFINSRYQVSWYEYDSPWGPLVWLAIVNKDRSARHDWRDFQRIKNELVGPEFEAFEMYPAESRLVDTNNQWHLFVLEKGKAFPIGFAAREVSDEQLEGSAHKQRPFDSPPEDLNAGEYKGKVWPVYGPPMPDEERLERDIQELKRQLEAQGGRGVDLAEDIDRLEEKLAKLKEEGDGS